jgi:hypothetical protein
MQTTLGTKGLNNSFQEPFKKTIKCQHCGKKAKIMFVADEWGDERKYVADLQRTTGKKGGLWLHDACAVAVYLCTFCFEGTVDINQA